MRVYYDRDADLNLIKGKIGPGAVREQLSVVFLVKLNGATLLCFGRAYPL